MNRRQFARNLLMSTAALSAAPSVISRSAGVDHATQVTPGFTPLFNGKDLSGFVDMNTTRDTWYVEDGLLKCTGEPIGVMRTEKQYENFILEIEWRHMVPGGNSGVFVWADGEPFEDRPFPTGMEVQMLDPQWAEINNRSTEYVHGQLFPVMGLDGTTPDNPSEVTRGRSSAIEDRVRSTGEWNHYLIVCVDGTLKLSVNGKFVNGIRSPKRKKGYICPEAEGSEIHFRKMNIMELPGGVITPDQTAPVVENLDSKRFI